MDILKVSFTLGCGGGGGGVEHKSCNILSAGPINLLLLLTQTVGQKFMSYASLV